METTENKSTKFKRLAEKRANKALENIRLLGNLSNRHNYSFSQDDVQKIFGILEEELKISKNLFQAAIKKQRKIKL